jgi:hypothetical protein
MKQSLNLDEESMDCWTFFCIFSSFDEWVQIISTKKPLEMIWEEMFIWKSNKIQIFTQAFPEIFSSSPQSFHSHFTKSPVEITLNVCVLLIISQISVKSSNYEIWSFLYRLSLYDCISDPIKVHFTFSFVFHFFVLSSQVTGWINHWRFRKVVYISECQDWDWANNYSNHKNELPARRCILYTCGRCCASHSIKITQCSLFCLLIFPCFPLFICQKNSAVTRKPPLTATSKSRKNWMQYDSRILLLFIGSIARA